MRAGVRLWIAAWLCLLPARAGADVSADPVLVLTAFGLTSAVHDVREPLFLSLVVTNPRPDAALVLGAEDKPLRQFITFRVATESGAPVLVTVRPLLSSPGRGTVMVPVGGGVELSYGIDPQLFAPWPDGRYTIQAVLAIRDEPDLWQGEARSKPLTLTLTRDVPVRSVREANQRDLQAARFYLLDQQFAQVEPRLQVVLSRDPQSVEAWQLRGGALAAQGRPGPARDAFRKALELWRDRNRFNPFQRQPPAELVRRADE